MSKIAVKIPENGFYYHYKHHPSLSINNYAYEVLGVGFHSEGNHDIGDVEGILVVYRPLYESISFKSGKLFDVRPLQMFMEELIKDGKTFPRFQKITDADILAKLEKIKGEMYKS